MLRVSRNCQTQNEFCVTGTDNTGNQRIREFKQVDSGLLLNLYNNRGQRMYSVQPISYQPYPQEYAYSANNTTKKIQNYTFRLNELLGKGNFSKVYRGVNELTNDPVAIKVVELSSIKTPALVDLLYSEIDIVKALNHPNILRCYEVFSSSNNCYIITEICDGNLESAIKRKGPMQERQASKVIYQIFQGLKYLAQQSIIHRDFKIANILMSKGIAKIADFGFAKRTKQRFKDISIGSPIYMSPEALIDHIYGPKTDVWAFGVFLYQILHGDTPLGFCQSEPELKMHIRTPIRPESINPRISYQLKDLILRCLDIDQKRRPYILEIDQMPYMRRLAAQFSYYSNSPSPQPIQNMQRPLTPKSFVNPQHSDRVRLMQPPVPRNQQQYSTSPNRFESSKQIAIEDAQRFERNNSYQNNGQEQYYNNGFRHQKEQLPLVRFPEQEKVPQNNPFGESASSYKIINPSSMLSFQQCVNLLHYCRLIYKTITQLKKVERFMPPESRDILTAWLFETFKDIQSKISTNVLFEGQKAAAKEQKLRDVIGEYHKKYYEELTIPPEHDIDFALMQQVLITLARFIDDTLQGVLQGSVSQRRDLIMAFHYLMYMYKANNVLQKCVNNGQYATFYKECAIESFLSTKRDNFDEDSYLALRAKLEKMG